MTANGPAIKGVCGAEPNGGGDTYPGYEENSTRAVMSEAWRNFCLSGYDFDGMRAPSRYNVLGDQNRIPVEDLNRSHRRSDRGTNWVEATFESRCRILMAGRCAYPGARALQISIASRARYDDQIQKERKRSGSYSTCNVCKAGVYVTCKNCDNTNALYCPCYA